MQLQTKNIPFKGKNSEIGGKFISEQLWYRIIVFTLKGFWKNKCGECALSEETNQDHKLKNATTLNFVSDVREQPTSK